jgi:hypothetical protein
LHDLRFGSGVEPVTAKVAIDALELETPGITSNSIPMFKHRDTSNPLSAKLVGRADAGGACAKYHHVRGGRRARVA